MRKILTRQQLNNIVVQFTKRIPNFGKRGNAAGKCKFASFELAKFLRKRGVPALVIHIEDCRINRAELAPAKMWADKSPRSWSHYVVRVGQTYVDVTARQFNNKAGYPHYYSSAEMKRSWAVVEVDHVVNRALNDILRSGV